MKEKKKKKNTHHIYQLLELQRVFEISNLQRKEYKIPSMFSSMLLI